MSEEHFFKEKPSSNILAQIIQRYLPFWPVFLVATFITMSIAFVYLRAQTRIYVASSKILLKDPQKGGGDSKVLDALNIFSEKKIVENEIIVLRSSSIMEEVVSSLNLYASVYNKGNVQTEELYKNQSPVLFEAIDESNIESTGKYFFDVDYEKQVISIGGELIPFNGIFKSGKTSYRLNINP
jgi:tyrosine-protein kinase Etk/Wzc